MRADNVKRFRKLKGLSMDKVRELTGLSKSTISDSENPEGNPTENTLQKLAEVYGVEVDDFYKDFSTNESDKTLEKEFPEGVYVLRRASKELTEEAKQQMISIMKTFLKKEDEEDEYDENLNK